MSTLNEIGMVEVKNAACDLLLAQRVETKLSGTKVEQVINRVRVAEPTARDNRERGRHIPQSVAASRAANAEALGSSASSTDLPSAPTKRRTQKDEQEDGGGAGVYSLPLQKTWELKQPEWVNDCIPEIMDGKNILDFVDPDIEQKLADLEAEEDERAQLAALEADGDGMEDENADAVRSVGALAKSIRKRKGIIREKARMEKKNNHPTMSRAVAAKRRTVSEFVEHMGDMGIKTGKAALSNLRRASISPEKGLRKGRADAREGRSGMEVEEVGQKRGRSASGASRVSADRSVTRRNATQMARSRSPSAMGLRDDVDVKKAEKMAKKAQAKITIFGHAGESDRRIPCKMPKHLNSGKRGMGKTDRR